MKGFALQALAERRGADAMEHLREALRDPNPAIRTIVIDDIVPVIHKALGHALLQEALADPEATLR